MKSSKNFFALFVLSFTSLLFADIANGNEELYLIQEHQSIDGEYTLQEDLSPNLMIGDHEYYLIDEEERERLLKNYLERIKKSPTFFNFGLFYLNIDWTEPKI